MELKRINKIRRCVAILRETPAGDRRRYSRHIPNDPCATRVKKAFQEDGGALNNLQILDFKNTAACSLRAFRSVYSFTLEFVVVRDNFDKTYLDFYS